MIRIQNDDDGHDVEDGSKRDDHENDENSDDGDETSHGTNLSLRQDNLW